MSVTTERRTVSPVLALVVVIVLLAIAVWGLLTNDSYQNIRPDHECVEWGVEVTNPNKTKGWALLPAIPRSKEEAEQIAQQLESQDGGGRYYEAKCRRFKGE